MTHPLPTERRCFTGRPGHIITAQKIVGSERGEHTPANLLEVLGSWIFFIAEGKFHQLWHHDPVRLYAVYDQVRRGELQASWNEEFHVLRFTAPERNHLLPLSDSPTPCKC